MHLPTEDDNAPNCGALLAGQAETDSDLVKRLTANELRVAELSIKQNRASQSTQTAQKLGAVRSAATLTAGYQALAASLHGADN